MDANYVTNKAVALIKALHNPPIGAKEFSGGWCPERVDAILFSTGSSYMIETKISRADFFADSSKDFRINPEKGVGRYRYYACPEGLILPEELPSKWGLIYVREGNRRALMPVGYGGHIRNRKKDTKHLVHGWTEEGFDSFGTKMPEELRVGDWWNSPEHPTNKFAFETDPLLERHYIYALATRYKKQNFMENIL